MTTRPRPTPVSPQYTPDGRPLPLPHERDERVGESVPAQPVVEQAGRDLASGQVDTDLRATPGLDAAQRERLVPSSPPLQKTLPKPASKTKPRRGGT